MNSVRFGLACIAFAASVTSAMAASDNIGVFNDWAAYASKQKGKSVCYVTSRPKETKMSKKASRGDAYIQVVHDQGRNVKGEVYIVGGFNFDEKKPVEATVDGKKHQLTAVKDAAWIYEAPAEKAFVAALSKGSTLVVKQTSTKGTIVTDTYSLKGFGAAKKAIDQACAK